MNSAAGALCALSPCDAAGTQRWRLRSAAALLAGSLSINLACATLEDREAARPPPGLEVLALSRGRGVPAATREVFEQIAARLEGARGSGAVVRVARSVIGLEGETRLCAAFRDRAALAALLAEIEALGADVELLEFRPAVCPDES